MSIDLSYLAAKFTEFFGLSPHWASRAPGRVNLIGEHIDYNGGLVLPAAINRDVAMTAALAPDGVFRVRSETFKQEYSWPVESLPEEPSPLGWPNYFLAVLDQFLARDLRIPPLWVMVDGDVPAAAGLSSSAAYEVCAARLFLAVQDGEMSGAELALLAQAAEHSHWVGVQCGIMDQFISANAIAGHALKINCGTLDYTPVKLAPEKANILIIHSTVRRELVTSAYNERRTQCNQALEQMNRASGQDRSFLAGYSPSEFARWGKGLSDPEDRRARHVVTEQARVLECGEALNRGDMARVGALLNQSHISLRDDYEVSCAELDSIHEIALGIEGVLGCRMTGAGFGGCAVALVQPDQAEFVATQLAERFEKQWGKRPWTLLTPACGGAESWEH